MTQTGKDLSKDPRVLFAAERTMLAWNRTCLSFMAFGFLIERFGIFVHRSRAADGVLVAKGPEFWIGIAFVLLGVAIALSSLYQYRRIFKRLKEIEISDSFNLNLGLLANGFTAAFGIALIVFLFMSS